jgi:ABC-type multidrug transport system fused ATPase/permease subunit
MVSWQVTLLSTVFFGAVAIFLAHFLNVQAKEIGRDITMYSIESNERIVEIFASIRESIVRNRKRYFANEILVIRSALSKSMASYNFMPFIGKYVIEGALVIATVFLVIFQSLLSDDKNGVAVLAFFLAAASRIAPSILRIQQSILQIKVNIAGANETLQLARELQEKVMETQEIGNLDLIHEGFIAKVECKHLHFMYPDRQNYALKDVTFSVSPGSVIAVVGPSGAGKTTLMDVMLGIVEPTRGEVLISGRTPREAINEWAGAIAYVPQDISLVRGSIKRNITLGFDSSEFSDAEVWSSLKKAQLEDFVLSLPEGIETNIGEVGSRMSGGQRQRLGIARALFTNPKLLVLDEATSALDFETEKSFKRALTEMRGLVTIIIIAHTPGMIQNADVVISLNDGTLSRMGDVSSFENSGDYSF